jgi:uncharacterized protein
MTAMERCGLIIFTKAPGAKDIKSRLAKTIGDGHARRLYHNFVLDLLKEMDQGSYSLKVFFDPPDQRGSMTAWLGKDRSYEPQEGADLGEKMRHAFEKYFSEGYEALILIGSDLPDLPAAMIEKGFATLKNSDAVIGPALDGGYYLIGFTAAAFSPDVFTAIPWGRGDVCESTCRIIKKKGLRLSVLPPWRDMDTIEDLRALMITHAETPFAESRTVRYIQAEKLLDQ